MVKKLFKEPLLYFFLLGGLAYAVHNPEVSEDQLTQSTIELPLDFVESQKEKFAKQFLRAPSSEELQGYMEETINEEILFREAWRLQLYVGDEIVRKRMIQKMRYVLEDRQIASKISSEEIKARVTQIKNSDKAKMGKTFDLSHIVFKDSDSAQTYINQITSKKSQTEPQALGTIAFPLGNEFTGLTSTRTEQLLGSEFVKNLDFEKISLWQGPIESRYGFHIVKLKNLESESFEHLNNTQKTVLNELIREKSHLQRQQAIDELKTRYQIIHPAP